METIKIASTHPESQGPYVLINAEDFDATQHQLYEEKATKKRGKGKSKGDQQEEPQEEVSVEVAEEVVEESQEAPQV